MKPLFVPLRRRYYEAFAAGEKTVEYRPHGPRWNAATCVPGRRVTLSLGYGKRHRLHGLIGAFAVNPTPDKLPGWTDCYGKRHGAAACIHIILDPPTTTKPR